MEIKQGKVPASGNYKKGRNCDIKYIVVHYTANKGDTALNNVKYFSNNKVSASAHYFVDENCIYTSVPETDTAYHCGGKLQGSGGHAWYKKCTNSNSLGIEMCMHDKSGNLRDKVIGNCMKLVAYLMEKYGISIDNVIRHYDVTGKMCPLPFVKNERMWLEFKGGIRTAEEEKMIKELEKRVKALEEKADEPVYNYIDGNLPDYATGTVKKLCEKGFLKGNEKGLGLTEEMLRILVVLDRAGSFGEVENGKII